MAEPTPKRRRSPHCGGVWALVQPFYLSLRLDATSKPRWGWKSCRLPTQTVAFFKRLAQSPLRQTQMGRNMAYVGQYNIGIGRKLAARGQTGQHPDGVHSGSATSD